MKKRHFVTFAALVIACLAINLNADDLSIQPLDDFESSGLPGGPFTPVLKQYNLTNDSNSLISWGVNSSAGWLQINPNWRLLAPGESVTVNVSLSSQVYTFGEGVYTATLTFLNVNTFQEQYRGVTLTVDFPDGFWVSPLNLDVNIIEGTDLSEKITIGNGTSDTVHYITWTKNVSSPASTLGEEKKILPVLESGFFSDKSEGRDFTIADNVPYKERELLIRFKNLSGKKLGENAKKELLKPLNGASIKRNFNVVSDLTVVKLPANLTVKQALKRLSGSEEILYAQPNYQVHALSTIPNDTRFSELWGLHNIGQNNGTADADIDAPEAWDIVTGSNEVIVAVIDSGVDYTHPDLTENMWVNSGEIPANGLDDDGNGYIDDVYGYDFYNDDGDPKDDYYHGTHVAGVIGAVGNNNLGVTGVCWNVKIMAIKFLNSDGTGWTDDAIEAIEYSILMGAELSNNSWGGGDYNQFLKDAIDASQSAGMLFVAGAGNGNYDNDAYPFYPANLESECIISVMSTDRFDLKSGSSSYGKQTVDLAAPGTSILSCKPSNQYQYLSGTSMSTAFVSGACALLWSIEPNLSNIQVKDILLHSVDKIDSMKDKCVSDGRLNIYKAISETKVPYLRLEPETGTIEQNTTSDFNVIFDTNCLEPDTYNAQILLIPDDPCCQQLNVPVTVTIQPDLLVVTPSDDFITQGIQGETFQPDSKKYTLTNYSNEVTEWTASWDADWLTVTPQSGSLEPDETIDVYVCLSSEVSLFDPNIYTDLIIFRNLNTNSIKKRNVSLTVNSPDLFTEFFDQTANQLSGMMITFTPDGSIDYYEACRDNVAGFPTDPAGGIYVPLWDDDFGEVILENEASVLFYGSMYERFYIGSNGYITFGQGDIEREPNLENHFALPRISALYTDLNPSSEYSVSYKQLDHRVAVTFEDVPVFGDKNSKNSFQVEMFFVSGQIRITWLEINATQAIVGLSEGMGLPGFLFEESDLPGYPLCWPLGDFNRDYIVNFEDMAALTIHWLDADCTLPIWCGGSDLNLNGNVDEQDLALLIGNWLSTN